jgi:pimeloyl-ACP methyl ester carboxylesterase
MLSGQRLDRLLAQASAYLDQEEIGHAAQAWLEAVIGAEPEVVIAHSLGTIVAYETLSRHPEWEVNGLMTMDSPLGGEMVVGPHDPAPIDDRAVFPVGVERRVNIRNTDDPDCIRPLTDVFERTIIERRVDNGHRMHDPERYLNNSTTGGAIAGMLSV